MINYIYNQIYFLQEMWILLGGCLTGRISGGYSQGMMGVGFKRYIRLTEED